MTSTARPIYPFTALVGQERMKRALLLNAVNPKLGGVLIRGEKGTAKSTAVRALANVLPRLVSVVDCPYGCDPADEAACCESCQARPEAPTTHRAVPIVMLPIGATEDRVIGTLDLEGAIQEGRRRFEPGLLAAANRGILYVDEVNLLNDHLVDVLLDAAAMGVNYVEREGVSVQHPAAFVLVGTMNPEEGDLRPQLLDRFALAVEVEGLDDVEARIEVVRRRIAFEQDPIGFAASWREAEEEARQQIARAQALLPKVRLDDRMLRLIAQLCRDFEVDGLRADIVMYKAAQTLAALAGRTTVNDGDVRDAAELALLHRRRRQPFQQPRLDRDELEEKIREHLESESESEPPEPDGGDGSSEGGAPPPPAGEPPREQTIAGGPTFQAAMLTAPADQRVRQEQRGRRSKTRSRGFDGHYVKAEEPRGAARDLALDATLRAAAPRQVARRRRQPEGPALRLAREDLRTKVRETRIGNLILFVVDASGSMAARQRMAAAKGAVMSLLIDAYQKRDVVGLVAFRGREATLLLPPTNSVELAERCLAELPTGGRTPLGHGVQLALETIEQHLASWPDALPLMVLVSDGRANVPLGGGDPMTELAHLGESLDRRRVHRLLVDTDQGAVRFGFAAEVAGALGARHVPIAELAARPLVGLVRETVGAGWGRA